MALKVDVKEDLLLRPEGRIREWPRYGEHEGLFAGEEFTGTVFKRAKSHE